MTTINEWLDKSDARAARRLDYVEWGDPNHECDECQEARIALATNALLRAALEWSGHDGDCAQDQNESCTCGYDEKVAAQKALSNLLVAEEPTGSVEELIAE